MTQTTRRLKENKSKGRATIPISSYCPCITYRLSRGIEILARDRIEGYDSDDLGNKGIAFVEGKPPDPKGCYEPSDQGNDDNAYTISSSVFVPA